MVWQNRYDGWCDVKFGFLVPTGGTDEVLELAVEIEAAGWDGFFYWDGIGGLAWDPWAMLAAVAVRTERVRLGAMIFPLPRRRPWKVAHETLTVDHLSHGRLVLPVGLGAVDNGGFSRVKPEAIDRRERAERLDETLAILGQAWSGQPVNHRGSHYEIDNMAFEPPAVQQPRIPVWVVAAWGRAKSMRRAAAWDGIIPNFTDGPDHVTTPSEIRAIREWMIANRADGTAGEIIVEGVDPDDDSEWAARELQPMAEAGATWWIYSPWMVKNDPETLRARIRKGPPVLTT